MGNLLSSKLKRLRIYLFDWPEGLIWKITEGPTIKSRKNEFDIVFSNAVLEYVGDCNKQKKFVTEILRVGRKCFISTPNYYFPLDSHTLIPFAHYLPQNIRFWIYKKLGRGYWANLNNLNLLKPKTFYNLLPNNINFKTVKQRKFGISYNLIVICDKNGLDHDLKTGLKIGGKVKKA